MVASSSQIRLLACLPEDLQDSAVNLSDEGNRQYAFSVSAGGAIIEILIEHDFVVLGGDLWRLGSAGYEHWGAGWYYNLDPSSSRQENTIKMREKWVDFYRKVAHLERAFLTFTVKD